MSINHHPDAAVLLAYASGAADEAVSLVVATHLALCAGCRRAVASAESAGGSLLETIKPESLAASSIDSVLARLDGQVTRAQPLRPQGQTPEPLRSYLGGDLSDVKWRKITSGISEHRILSRGNSIARLLKARPGSAVAEHTHKGEELTLVLTGGLGDHTGEYHRGDVQTATPELMHVPTALPGEDCIVLAATDAPLRFKSLPMAIFAKVLRF
jgi:putative transcriptional regulator